MKTISGESYLTPLIEKKMLLFQFQMQTELQEHYRTSLMMSCTRQAQEMMFS